jgi:UDP-3-O-[3-hydroxymyristoyl] glucosamine N-acyltransferase
LSIHAVVELLRDEGMLASEPAESTAGTLSGFSPFGQTRPGTLTWSLRPPENWSEIRAAALLCPPDLEIPAAHPVAAIRVRDPRNAIARVLREFVVPALRRGAAATAIVSPGAQIASDAFVGDHCVIEDGVAIGPRTQVHSGVKVYAGCQVGADCVIQSGAVLGSHGFGYEKDDDGRWFRIEHVGRVLIGDRVEIGANTCVDRGALGDTIIGSDTKIDNLAHIGHNAQLGENCGVAALAGLGGSRYEEGTWIGFGAIVEGGLSIGEGAVVGSNALVRSDVAPGEIVAGVPARPLRRSA